MSAYQRAVNRVPKVTTFKLIQAAGLSAVVAGLLFVLIQPLHPGDTLASVSTQSWTIIHIVTLFMAALFLVGIAGIYARQVEELGWLGLAGYVLLSLGLLVQMPFGFVEAFIQPLLAEGEPKVVEGLLGLVNGSASEVSLGAIPAIWATSGLLFLLGILLFGIANLRAGILSRWASGVFAFGLLVFVPLGSLLPHEFQRLGAVPVGVGLAWLGYSLWSERPEPTPHSMPAIGTPAPGVA